MDCTQELQAQVADLQRRLDRTTQALTLSTELVVMANQQRDAAQAKEPAEAAKFECSTGFEFDGVKFVVHFDLPEDGGEWVDDCWCVHVEASAVDLSGALGAEAFMMGADGKRRHIKATDYITKSAEAAIYRYLMKIDADAAADAAERRAEMNAEYRRAA